MPASTKVRRAAERSPAASGTGSDLPQGDLPFFLAGLYHGFRGLVDRLHLDSGLHLRSVSPGMGTIFLALREADGCNVKHLVRLLRIPNATLTGLLDRMEESGVIERHPCPDDGRAFRVRLTAFGRSLEAGMGKRHDRAMDVLQAGFAESEVAELKRLLARVLTNLRADEERWRAEMKAARAKARAESFAKERGRKRRRPTSRGAA